MRGLTLARYYLDDAGGTRSNFVQGRFQAILRREPFDENASWGIEIRGSRAQPTETVPRCFSTACGTGTGLSSTGNEASTSTVGEWSSSMSGSPTRPHSTTWGSAATSTARGLLRFRRMLPVRSHSPGGGIATRRCGLTRARSPRTRGSAGACWPTGRWRWTRRSPLLRTTRRTASTTATAGSPRRSPLSRDPRGGL